MDNLINFIMSGQTDFTPETLIRFVVFVLILSCISSIAQNVINVNKYRFSGGKNEMYIL